MGMIIIKALEVFYHVGVPDEERANPQRLLVTVEMSHDLSTAAESDDLARTIDYHAVAKRLARFGEGRSWKLIEKVAGDIARTILEEFGPGSVEVEVKKFILRETRYVAVQLTRRGGGLGPQKLD
jgi:FolB domain-containing protein